MTRFDILALGIFLLVMSEYPAVAIASWLFFIAFVKPRDWSF